MKSKKRLSMIAFIGAALVSCASAFADFDMKAGPIQNQGEAAEKCAKACTLTWNSAWVTKTQGKLSICSGNNNAADGKQYVIMDSTGGVEAGAIGGNTDAQTKCPEALAKVKWNGQWRTVAQGQMSVCGCAGGKVLPWKPNVIEK
jgi:hypothetical protein